MANEKRLIDANAVKALFDERYDDVFVQERTRHNTQFWNGLCCGVNWGRNTIADTPTVDAVEVVHGKWIEKEYCEPSGGYYLFHCSECCAPNAMERNYCPNCGAKMDGGNDDA